MEQNIYCGIGGCRVGGCGVDRVRIRALPKTKKIAARRTSAARGGNLTKKKQYPGKPGPAATGLTRTIPLLVMLNVDESEHLNRLERDAKENGDKEYKKVQIIRARVFRRGELDLLRQKQGANIWRKK